MDIFSAWGSFLEQSFLTNTYLQWLSVIFSFIVLGIFVVIVRMLCRRFARKESQWIATDLLRFFANLPGYFWWSIIVYIPLQFLSLHSIIATCITIIFLIIVALQIIRLANFVLISLIPDHLHTWDNKGIQTTNNVLQLFIKIFVRTVVVLLVLINLGVEITPLLAWLGIGWIAVAFALQNILADLFASISLFLERPFDVWDFVSFGEYSGSVTKITLKSTYLTDVSWKKIVIPNQDVTNSRLENVGRMEFRRKRFTIWVIYETPPALLRQIPKIIQQVVDANEDATFERAHLADLNAYSIDFLISYKLEEPTYQFSLQIHENIVYDIVDAFAKHKLEFAYPTQVIHTQQIEKK